MDNLDLQKVSVVNIDMPFFSMVGFMVKWTIAAIPAMFILVIIGAFFFAMLAAIGIGSGI
jgi:hypothetical protein